MVSTRVPRHVAIIMDGNRRWARARRFPVIAGHRRGIIALRDILEVRLEKEFHSLHREIWSVLKDEVLKGYAQASQATAS